MPKGKSKSLGAYAWVLVLLLCASFQFWSARMQIKRAEYVTSIAQQSSLLRAASPTGYANNTRELIIPEHLDACYAWIAQTQQMFAKHEWRVREIDYENAPVGRSVHTASPYRWWLGLIAWADHCISGRPIGLSVERAALWADPLLYGLLLLATTIFVARYFGSLAAVVAAVGLTTLFPLAAGFLPAVPEDFCFAIALALWSLLPLVVGLGAYAETGAAEGAEAATPKRSPRRWFFFAGLVGGIGLWIDVTIAVPLQCGIALGGLLAAWAWRNPARRDVVAFGPVAPWRAWAFGGAVAVLASYFIEYAPAHLSRWELRVIHPLYGVAWLGGGEVLALGAAWIQRAKSSWRVGDFLRLLAGMVGLAVLPFAMWKTSNAGFLAINLLSFHLTKQMDGVLAPNFKEWLVRDGVTAVVFATAVPLVLVAVGGWTLFQKKTGERGRVSLAMVLGTVVVFLFFAWYRLRWWQVLDALLLVLAIVGAELIRAKETSLWRRSVWLGSLGVIFLASVLQLTPLKGTAAKNVLSLPEVEGLVERDLAHWLAKHTASPAETIVLAPPSVSSALYFYGGLRGLGSLAWENKDGLSVALRIVISTSREEAQALIQKRGVTYLVLPSWDSFFEDYTRPAAVQAGEMFYTGLHRWALPLWLKPVPFQLPKIAGFDEQSIAIFQVVDEQDEPAAMSRLAEYFVETNQLARAQATALELKRFPADLGSLVARAQVAIAARDADTFAPLFETLVKRVAAGGDRVQPWDRRVSLAVVLARGQQMDLARKQIERCLKEIDETRVRSLTTFGLFHLETLRKTFGLEIQPPELRELIQSLSAVE